MTESAIRVRAADLHRFVVRAFLALGLEQEEAELCADGLVQSELRGLTMQMQGVNRLPVYFQRLRDGLVTPRALFEIVRESPALAIVDAHNGLGYAAATRAMRLAIAKAQANGMASVFVRHSTHFGGASVHARRALDARCIGIAMSNASPEMAPWGGITPVLGTNPWAIAVPSQREFPIVLDMAITTSGKGSMMGMLRAGKKMPLDWAITRAGLNTDDPAEAMDGTLLPIGGPKGYGLSLMTDVLTGVLTGSAFGSKPYSNPAFQDVGHLLTAIEIEWFMPFQEFQARLDTLLDEIRASELRPGVDRIYLPGEIEHLREQDKLEHGVPLERSVVQDLAQVARDLNLPFDLEDISADG